MLKKMPLESAIGTELTHDITEINERGFKGPAFRKGQTVRAEDICHLQRLGRNHLYRIEAEADEIHENEAAVLLASALAGDGIVIDNAPSEGKINLYAAFDGLLTVDAAALARFNLAGPVMCATLHTHSPVKKSEMVGATRAIPLVMKRRIVEDARDIARANGGILSVAAYRPLRAGLVITGNEVSQGLIADRFEPILTRKVRAFGGDIGGCLVVPDDAEAICRAIECHLENGCNLVLLSAGMSVDPDDVTRQGIALAGADAMHYGAAALPGAMFLSAAIGETPVLGVPACALHFETTVLDLLLPRIMAGFRVNGEDLAMLGHGGLCRTCRPCTYPSCSFGKG